MPTSLISIKHWVSAAECHGTIRQLRWPDGVICPHGDSGATLKRGFDGPERHVRRYACKTRGRRFDDLTGTVLADPHQPLSVWVLCLYCMGLNLSHAQIVQELDLNKDDVQAMTACLREGLAQNKTR